MAVRFSQVTLRMDAGWLRPSLRQRADQRLIIFPFSSGFSASVQTDASSGLGASAILANRARHFQVAVAVSSCQTADAPVSSRPIPVT